MVQLKPLKVHQDLRQPIYISARANINHPAYSSARAWDSSARFKTISKQFNQDKKITLPTVQLEPVTIQLDLRQPVDSLARLKPLYMWFS